MFIGLFCMVAIFMKNSIAYNTDEICIEDEKSESKDKDQEWEKLLICGLENVCVDGMYNGHVCIQDGRCAIIYLGESPS